MIVPLVRTLQSHYPHAKITWIISRPAYDLVEGMDGIEFIVIEKPNSIMDYWRFRQTLKKRKFDVLLATQSSFRANLLYACIKAKRRIGFDYLRAKDFHSWFINETIKPGKDHTVDGFLRFAEALGIEQFDIRWDLPISDAERDFARSLLPINIKSPIILVNPAASKPERSWLASRYIEVLQYAIKEFNAQIILIGGPGAHDKELGDAIALEVPVLNLIGQTKPKQLLALISLSDLVLCPDTGPSHMAAAVNTKVIALHAVTSKDVSGPYTFRELAVDYYPEAVKSILQKTEATNIWGTHAHGKDTMKLVEVDAVKAKLANAIA